DLTWYMSSTVVPASVDIDPYQMWPIQGDLMNAAREFASLGYGSFIVETIAICLPIWTGLTSDDSGPLSSSITGPDSSSPDTSRPYPLDDLLSEIEGLTG